MQGVNIYITVFDRDQGRPNDVGFVPFDVVDEFNFNFTARRNGLEQVFVEDGIRVDNRSR